MGKLRYRIISVIVSGIIGFSMEYFMGVTTANAYWMLGSGFALLGSVLDEFFS
jgi:hypothetical protein